MKSWTDGDRQRYWQQAYHYALRSKDYNPDAAATYADRCLQQFESRRVKPATHGGL